MVYSLSYRLPPFVPPEPRSSLGSESEESDDNEGQSSLRSGNSNPLSGIPDALAFDRIINGGTCPVSAHTDTFLYILSTRPANVWQTLRKPIFQHRSSHAPSAIS